MDIEQADSNGVSGFLYKIVCGIFGLGLAGIIVHNPDSYLLKNWLIPTTGLFLILLMMPVLLVKVSKTTQKLDPWAVIPMSIILAFVGLSMGFHTDLSFLNNNFLVRGYLSFLSPFVFGFMILSIYFIVKTHPHILEIPFATMVIFATTGIAFTAFTTGLKSGGWITGMNYDTTVPLLVIGTLLAPKKWQWWLSGVSIIGLFFSGAEIGLVVIAVVVLVIIIRGDGVGINWRGVNKGLHLNSEKILLPVVALLFCLLVATPSGITHSLWVHNGIQGTLGDRIQAATWAQDGGNVKSLDYLLTGNRLNGNWHIRPITLTGHGLEIDKLTETTPHNQFLIITDQIGIIAALAWLFATLAWGIRTKNYYILAAILSVAMLDHYFWTVGILWWWAFMGVESKGLIFSETNH
jgi:hypothetical protein